MKKICVVLNGYKRPHTLNEQIQAVKNNSIKPNEILFWKNAAPSSEFLIEEPNLKIAVSNVNWGVWSRFYYALNSKSDYICVFDDDTIPGSLWFFKKGAVYQLPFFLQENAGKVYCSINSFRL